VPIRENQFERATELFYEAAAVPELWPAALQAVAEACGAAGGVILPVFSGPATAYPSPGIEEYVHDLVADGWASTNNSRMQRGLALTMAGMTGLITDSDMFTPDELEKDTFYNEFIRPHRMGATAGMVLARSGHEIQLPFAMERHARDGPFMREDVVKMNRLMARARPAAELALKVGLASARRLADSFAGAGRDIVLLGPSGRVIHMPPDFERHLGDAVTLRAGALHSWHSATDMKLGAAVKRAVSRGPAIDRVTAVIPLPRRNRRRPLMVRVVPIIGSGQDLFMLARAAMIVTDPDWNGPADGCGEALAVMGLTPAEVRLAVRIGQGADLREVARAERVAVETARARLKAVFAKTGTHRQAELAVLVASLRG
jgi:DNA-binding CsgD family transcriptional regulator